MRVALMLLLSTVACTAAAQSSSCSPDDDTGVNFLGDVVGLLASTDPEIVESRERFYNVPAVPVSSVEPVRDSPTLGRARGALAKHLKQAPSRCIYVLKLGEAGFAVFDPAYRVGHYDAVFIFDQAWRNVGGWTG